MKENLKKIKVFTEIGPIEVMDSDNTPLDEYTKQLSNLLQSSNVSILETSSGCLIIRPSRTISILVTEEKRVKEIKKAKTPKVVSESEERLEES